MDSLFRERLKQKIIFIKYKMKVGFLDGKVWSLFWFFTSIITSSISAFVIFKDIPADLKPKLGVSLVISLVIIYFVILIKSNFLKKISVDIEGSSVIIKKGDIFKQDGLKAIAFNEYFDTKVDERIIAKSSLNGIFVNKLFPNKVNELDRYIEQYDFEESEKLEYNDNRRDGKKQSYQLGTICVYDDFLLTAFSKFDSQNKANLTMPQYLEFLINFWDQLNRHYGQKNVSVPIFGTGITRIKEHKNISDEELLKIMLWTFRISEMRFKYPANLTIVIHKDKINKINLHAIKSKQNGL